MNKLVSIDLYADFGCLKKPDTNDPIYLTFNMLHKPALLGMLGAIVGLEGFLEAPPKPKKKKTNDLFSEQEKPKTVASYYEVLKDLKIGIRPLRHENGNFSKTTIRYNNGVGYANLDGGNLLVTEQTLIAPAYRCYLLFEKDVEVFRQLFQNLQQSDAEYLPYMGKNEFSVYWKNWQEYDWRPFEPGEGFFEVKTIFIKEEPLKDGKVRPAFSLSGFARFMYFENLPVGYDVALMQYEYEAFAFSDNQWKQNFTVKNLYHLHNTNEIVQLF